jgi:hypothetical protein
MDELFALVYFLIALNMCVVLFMGYKECNNKDTNFKVGFPLSNSSLNKDEGEMNLETDNIFTRRS